MSNYRTFTKEKWLYFVLSVVSYFAPFIIVTASLLPVIKVADGFKVAMGLCIVFINAIPFLMGIFKSFFAHFPMFNMLALVFLILAAFFTLDVFQTYADRFLWIETAAALGSIVSCVFWAKYRKYAKWQQSVKATVKSGAFEMKEKEDNVSDQGS
ncbi:MAG: hypothetical protein K2N30_02555 [Clostridia bacterium]|nr:hypothetical protein [Clostridia bacterium]